MFSSESNILTLDALKATNEQLQKLVDAEFADCNDLAGVEVQENQICSKMFKRGDLVYHCDTCTADATCVQCSDCFKRSLHAGHEYEYYITWNEGGCCDCAELESWKPNVFVPHCQKIKHSQGIANDHTNEIVYSKVENYIELFGLAIKDFCSPSNPTGDNTSAIPA